MRLGILGAGQLGRMLAIAALPLGIRCSFLDPTPDSPASQLAGQTVADYLDEEGLARFAGGLDAVTYEFENVPVEAAHRLAARLPVLPPAVALQIAQDRLPEKLCLREHGFQTAEFQAVGSREELDAAVSNIGLPAILKTRRSGYDGKGQRVIRTEDDIEGAFASVGGVPLILEQLISFDRELSILAVRGQDGSFASYPLVQNTHREGILRRSVAPAPDISRELQSSAGRSAERLCESLGYVGVLAIEFFEADGRLLANEMAPRVHNSGHWSIEGAETSQFENHVRAVCGLPLGSTGPVGFSAMVNLIGKAPDLDGALGIPDCHVHLYGKAARAGRKLGHITLRASSRQTLEARLSELAAAGVETE